MEFYLKISEKDNNEVLIEHSNSWIDQQYYTLSAEEAMDAIIPNDFANIETGILPPVVKYLSPSGRNIILERPPQVVTLNYHGVLKDKIDKETTLQQFDIALPWTIYGITLNDNYQPLDVYVYATPKPIGSTHALLYLLPITNYELDGKFCAPLNFADEAKTIGEAINLAYSAVWSSSFNLDITEVIEECFDAWKPENIFNGRGDRDVMKSLKISNFYKRWEEFSLEEVARFTDWLPARMAHDGSTTKVKHLLQLMSENEAQLVDPMHLYNRLRTRISVVGKQIVDIK